MKLQHRRLGALVASKREQLSLTIRAAADQAGVSYSTLFRIEAGRGSDLGTVLAVCRWLGVSVEDAYGVTTPDGCASCVRLRAQVKAVRKAIS